MSREVNKVFVDSFDAEVHREYQGIKTLRDSVRVKTGVIGKSHSFPKSGQGVASRHIHGNDATAMNLDFNTVLCTLEDWEAKDYVDIFDIEKLNFSEKTEVAFNTASAIGRREDQIILDAASAATNTIGGATTAFDVDLIASIAKTFNENNVDPEDRYIVWSASQQEALLNETKAGSSDYNSVKVLVSGEMNSYYGFKFKLIGNRVEGGLTKPTATSQLFYAYHKKAIGLAIGLDMNTAVDWIAEKSAWFIGMNYSAGAIIIDNDAVLKGTSLIAA